MPTISPSEPSGEGVTGLSAKDSAHGCQEDRHVGLGANPAWAQRAWPGHGGHGLGTAGRRHTGAVCFGRRVRRRVFGKDSDAGQRQQEEPRQEVEGLEGPQAEPPAGRAVRRDAGRYPARSNGTEHTPSAVE